MNYDNLTNITGNFLSLLNIEGKAYGNGTDDAVASLKQNIEFLNSLISDYDKEP